MIGKKHLSPIIKQKYYTLILGCLLKQMTINFLYQVSEMHLGMLEK